MWGADFKRSCNRLPGVVAKDKDIDWRLPRQAANHVARLVLALRDWSIDGGGKGRPLLAVIELGPVLKSPACSFSTLASP